MLELGHRVRVVRRRPEPSDPRWETRTADVSDPTQARQAFEGAELIIHAAVPAYHRWGQLLLPLTQGIIAGAEAVSAKLIALDNVYAYGRAPGGRMHEGTPVAPCSKKGQIRAEAAALLLEAYARKKIQVRIGRASDFLGPGALLAAAFGDRFWSRLLAGKSVETLGDPDQPHSYSYLPDVVEGLVLLATREAEDRPVWHLPALAAEPSRTWIDRFASAAGVRPKLSPLTPMALRLAGLFIPEAGEVREMLYQWQHPFVLEDGAFRAAFQASSTPVEEVVRATVRWAEARYGRAGATKGGWRSAAPRSSAE